ncbi:KIF1BP isoform 1, partial [Pan troglodytes]
HSTLKRQLEHNAYHPIEWAINAATLSQFYINKKNEEELQDKFQHLFSIFIHSCHGCAEDAQSGRPSAHPPRGPVHSCSGYA